MNLKNGKVFTSKFVGTGPSSYKKRIYRAAVSQRLRKTGLKCWTVQFLLKKYLKRMWKEAVMSWDINHCIYWEGLRKVTWNFGKNSLYPIWDLYPTNSLYNDQHYFLYNLLDLSKKYTVMWYIFHKGTFPILLKFQEFFSLCGVSRTNLTAVLWYGWPNYSCYFIYFIVRVSEIQIAVLWEGKYFCLAFFSVIKL